MKHPHHLVVSVGRNVRNGARVTGDQDLFHKGVRLIGLGLDAVSTEDRMVDIPSDLESLFPEGYSQP